MQTGNTIYCNSPGRVTGSVTRKYTGAEIPTSLSPDRYIR